MQLYSVGTKIIRGKRNKRVVDKRREEQCVCNLFEKIYFLKYLYDIYIIYKILIII